MAPRNIDHSHKEQVADELRETNEKLIQRLAGHRLTEEVMRKDAQTFRAIVDTLPVGVSLAEDRKLTWANPAFMKIHGFESPNDYFGQSTEILFASHDEFERAGRVVYSDLEVGNIAEITVKQKRKDGSVFDAHLQFALFGASDCTKRIVVCCTTDMSGQVEAEDRLRRSEERYRMSLEQSFDGALIVKGSKILFANSRLSEMLGYSKEEFEGIEYSRFLHPDCRELVVKRAAARIRGESVPGYYEIKLLRKDGSSFDAEISARVIEMRGEACIQAWVRDLFERKKAEEAAQQSEERYRTLVEQAFDGIMIIDGKKILFANSRVCEMLGYQKDELEGIDHWITLHPDYRDMVTERAAARAFGKEVPGHYFVKQLRKDGSSFDSEINSRAIEIQGVPAVQVWIKDISERKKAEEALHESEKKYRAVFDNAPAGINLNHHGRVLEANSAWANMLGYSQDELKQLTFRDITYPDDLEITEKYHDRLVRGEVDSYRFEKRYVRKGGRILWADVCVSAIRDEVGRYEATISSVIDISDKKQAEEALRTSEANYRAIFDSMNDAIFVHDLETGAILDVNKKMSEMYGYAHEEASGLEVADISSGEEGYSQERALHWVELAAKGDPQLFEWHAKAKDGRLFWVEVNLKKAILDSKPCVLAVVRDITDRKRAEQERENLRHQLLHAQKMEALGTLVGGIAHDFNNLLTIILGYSELLLLEKAEDDPDAADLKKVVEAASNGAALVQRMLTFSEQTDTMLGPLNLNREIENMKELLSRTIPKMISLDLRPAEGLALIDGDAAQIQQVIMNLALNAVDAMPDGGKLTIETKNATLGEDYGMTHPGITRGNYVLLTVSDTGHGMGTQTMERMYDPFFTTKNRDFTKGTGLGLATVHGIVQGHGGQIMCSSEPEKGTRFELYFPAISYEELISEERAEDSGATTSSVQGTETILLVDDEEMVRDLGARILKKAGYKVHIANNGKEALAIYEKAKQEIALVILDLIMPKMGGEQCLEGILKINPKAKILISTGYSSGDQATRMRIEALVSGFVAKPFALSHMLKAVREILDKD